MMGARLMVALAVGVALGLGPTVTVASISARTAVAAGTVAPGAAAAPAVDGVTHQHQQVGGLVVDLHHHLPTVSAWCPVASVAAVSSVTTAAATATAGVPGRIPPITSFGAVPSTTAITAFAAVAAHRGKDQIAAVAKAHLLAHLTAFPLRGQELPGHEDRVVVGLEAHQHHACVLATLSRTGVPAATTPSASMASIAATSAILARSSMSPRGIDHVEWPVPLGSLELVGVSPVNHGRRLRRYRPEVSSQSSSSRKTSMRSAMASGNSIGPKWVASAMVKPWA